MSTQADFTPDEWATLKAAMHEPGAAVMLAAPGGQLTEFFAIARAMLDAPGMFKDSELVSELLASGPTRDAPTKETAGAGRFIDQMIGNLRRAVAIVDTKASADEAQAYRTLVLFIAEKIASAAKESGELAVTAEEQRVLDEIQLVLRRKG